MGDKVLSDILLFKQLDEASKQPITRDETNNTNNNYINNINTNNNNNNSILEVKKKKVIIVKKNVVNDSPMLPEIVDTTITATPTKKVVVARKVKLGDSFLPPLTKSENTNSNINNNNNNNINNGNNVIGNVSQSISSHDGTIPLSIISRGKRGPKYDAENRILERSLLGSPDDYLAWKPTGVTVVAPVAVTRPPSPPPSLSPSPSLSLSSTSRPRTAADADDLIGLMKTMSFHEKVRYLKEENALHRWERTVAEWERMKKAMASRTGRDVDQVLLTRSEAFRTVMEHKELIERALATRDHAVSDLFSSPLLPMDSGLFLPLRPPSREPMEMIGRPKAQRSRPTSSYYSARKLELQDSVNMLAPYEPDLDGLSIVGTPISRMIEPPNFSSLSNFPTLAGISSLEAANPSIASLSTYVHPPSTYDGWTDFSPMSTPSAQRYMGPKVLFEGAHQTQMQEMQETQETQELRVVCEVAVGGLARAELHAHNVGSTAIYYRWRKVDRERVFQVKEETDTTQRFYFHDVQGVMLPSETHTFIFGFKSDNHGIFFEKWVFESSPTLSTPGPTLTLKGIAIQEDDTAEARYQLEEAIGAKQINHGVQDIIRSMIDCIKPVVKPIPPLEDLDMEQEFFLRQNRDLHLYYSTENCKAFQSLARSTFETLMFSEDKKWNFSVLSLHEDIQCIHDERQRSDLLSDLNCLIEQASMPNHCTTTLPYLSSNTSSVGDKTVFYCLAYDLLVQLADRVPSLSSSIRESFSLPPVAFVPAEDDFLRKVDSYGNILDLSKQKMKDLSKRKGGSRRKLAESPDKRQESPPRKKKDKSKEKDEDSDKAEDERHKSPVRKRLSRGRTRERDKADAPKEKEKEEKPHSIKESMAVSTRRLKKKKPEEEEKKEEEEEEWSVERKAKEGDYKNELFSQVRELVIETFVRYRQLAQEAEAVARRVSQDLFFQTIAASSPNPMDRFLEGELMAMEEREEREEEMDDAQSTVSYSYPKNTPRESANFSNINSNINAKNNSNSNLNELAESEYPLDARARRRRRVLNRK